MMAPLFSGMVKNAEELFRGRALLVHGAAIALTATLVVTGFDEWWYRLFEGTPARDLLFSAAYVGFFVPVFLPLALLFIAYARSHQRLMAVSYAIGQAEILALLVSYGYKALTGRVHPDLFGATAADLSRTFNFGEINGVFWGWPSSHTAAAFALALACAALCRRRATMAMALAYALYIGVGVSTSIHWFSDFVAGAILGGLAGHVVGSRFELHGMHEYAGTVARGMRRGSELGYPTLNIPLRGNDLRGVYAGVVWTGGAEHRAALFADPERGVLEAYLLDFSGDLYGARVSIVPWRLIRASREFHNDEELKKTIAGDVAAVREYFRKLL